MNKVNSIISLIVAITFVVGIVGWTYETWGLFASLVCGSISVFMVKSTISAAQLDLTKFDSKKEENTDSDENPNN